jgi:hypothetical protein
MRCALTSRVSNQNYRAGGATGFVALIQSLILLSVAAHIDIYTNKRFLMSSEAGVILFLLAVYFVNQYLLVNCGYGIKFANEFHLLPKSRRLLLIISWSIVVISAIALAIESAMAYRHFIGID